MDNSLSMSDVQGAVTINENGFQVSFLPSANHESDNAPAVLLVDERTNESGDASWYPAGLSSTTDEANEDAYKQLSENSSSSVNATKNPVVNEESYTVEKAIEQLGFGPFQLFMTLACGLAWVVDAMEMMLLSILSPALECSWRLTPLKEAAITTVVFVGMMLFSPFWGYVSDKYGRRFGLIFSSLLTFYFGALSAFSPSFGWMLVLRGLTGCGIAGAPQAITYYSEFLPSKARATCIIVIELFWGFGAVLAVLLAIPLMPVLGWRWLVIACSVPLLVFAILCKWMPESARYDVVTGNKEGAVATLQKIAKWNGKPMPLGELKVYDKEEGETAQFKDLFSPTYRVTTILLWTIWVVCAFSYFGIVLATTEMFKELDEADGKCIAKSQAETDSDCIATCAPLTTADYIDTLYTTLAEFPGMFLAILMVEPLGRKKSMGVQLLLFAIFAWVSSICMSRQAVTVVLFITRAFVTAAFQTAYVYTPEVYPTSIRAIGVGSCSAFARIGALTTPFVAQMVLKYNIGLAMGIYFCSGLVAAICAVMLPIETKGRAMESSVH